MKKRKIRYDRLLLVILVPILICVCIFEIVSYVKELQFERRKQLVVELIKDGKRYNLDADRFKLYKDNKLTLEELNDYCDSISSVVPIDNGTDQQLVDLGEFRLTGYCNCEICCGVWSGGPCYNGEMPESEWTIAVDPDVIPIGSLVKIEGFDNLFCAQDTGSAINENHIDIYCNSHEECFNPIYNRIASVYLIK